MAHIIGNRRHALALWSWWQLNERDPETTDAPKGFRRIGSGGQRVAFLHVKSGVVYKIQHQDRWADGGQGYCSETELRNARVLRALVRNRDMMWAPDVRIPKVSGMSVRKPSGENALVIAMEFVKGHHRHKRDLYHVLRTTGLNDLHTYNAVTEDSTGHVVPIDLGAPMDDVGKPLALV